MNKSPILDPMSMLMAQLPGDVAESVKSYLELMPFDECPAQKVTLENLEFPVGGGYTVSIEKLSLSRRPKPAADEPLMVEGGAE